MGNRRIGLKRIEALLEAVDRDLDLTNSTLTNCSITSTAACNFSALQLTSTARTATDDGTGTGTIADGTSFVTVDADSDADHIIILPTPTPGTIVYLTESGTTGYELRSSAPDSVAINGGSGAGFESAIAGAITYVRCVCVSATSWIATQFAADGTESKVEAANNT